MLTFFRAFIPALFTPLPKFVILVYIRTGLRFRPGGYYHQRTVIADKKPGPAESQKSQGNTEKGGWMACQIESERSATD